MIITAVVARVLAFFSTRRDFGLTPASELFGPPVDASPRAKDPVRERSFYFLGA